MTTTASTGGDERVAAAAAPDGAPRRSGTGSALTIALGVAAFATLAATVVRGLSLPDTLEQGPYSKLIAIHPPVAWAAYLGLGVTAVASVLYLVPRTRSRTWDHVAAASAEIAAVFTALMLVTGSIWGRPTWGVWWVWDARLTLSALMFALVLGYLALRRVPADGDVRAKRSAIAALLGVLVVPVNHFAVEWWRTLHQGRSLAQLQPENDLDGAFIGAMLLGFVAMTLVYGWLLVHRVRLARLEEGADDRLLALALEERRAESGPGAATREGVAW